MGKETQAHGGSSCGYLREKGLDETGEPSGCQMEQRLAAELLRAKGMSEISDPNRDLVTGQAQARATS